MKDTIFLFFKVVIQTNHTAIDLCLNFAKYSNIA